MLDFGQLKEFGTPKCVRVCVCASVRWCCLLLLFVVVVVIVVVVVVVVLVLLLVDVGN